MTIRSNHSEFSNVLAFALLALVWGTSYAAIDVGLATLPPLLFAGLRYDLAGLVLLGAAVATGARLVPRTRAEAASVLVGGTLLIAVHIALLFAGQRYVDSGTAAIVLSTAPVLTPVFAWALLGERFTAGTAVGGLLGLLGVGIVASPAPGSVGDAFLFGLALLGLSALSFAVGAVLLERLPGTLPTLTAQSYMMLFGAALLHVGSPLLGEPLVRPTGDALWAVAYLGLVSGAVGYLLYFVLLESLGSVTVSMVNYAVPVVAAATGWLLLGQTLPATAFLGFAVIAAGFAVMQWTGVVRIQARLDRGYTAENEYVVDAAPLTETAAADD